MGARLFRADPLVNDMQIGNPVLLFVMLRRDVLFGAMERVLQWRFVGKDAYLGAAIDGAFTLKAASDRLADHSLC